ncbi:AAA family ATPase [Salinisphaera hydrothermalis]|uniref:Aminoglycoside phosphotransferase n=1 Tax=Salinisphaera hydrothermalis (strain C41B8) TaxID=1304275 RepID=A0A084IHX2_SALHC|nr:bifunctional aminoglycoside phosphotransferase/ATP-binding protein [Salinisphaera hydrothermalis]KEZ76306.1 aminoglycoside phosphotransferase [Salinisphaera hydrothermalis C41B8]
MTVDNPNSCAHPLDAQRRLIDALQHPNRYPHAVDSVRRIETHISILLLAGDYVYKIKKAVRLPFVDYGTLERRRTCCEAEIRLNRRYAPDIYLDCVAVHAGPDGPSFADSGPVIEYAVRMARFAPEAQGDVCARDGRITIESVDGLAATIARYHDHAPSPPPRPDYGSAEAVIATAKANLDEYRVLIDPTESSIFTPLDRWMRERLARAALSFEQRRAAGFVRECHGDMHLANLIYRTGYWEAFDCVEFDAALRWIDVMDDMAFTLMDLYAHGLVEPAHRFLNHYLEITGDYAGLAVLRLYLVHRALVRAKVALLGGAAQPAGGNKPHYLDTARALSIERPRLVITHGISGSGKSWAAERVAEHFGYVRIRSDIERKRLHGLPPLNHQRAGAFGRGMYSDQSSTATYDRLFELAEIALSEGWPVILDAAFLDTDLRDAARAVAHHAGCPFHILDMDVSPEMARRRLRARGDSDASDANERILDQQLARYRPLAPDERDDALTTSGACSELRALFESLESPASA